MPVDTTYDRLNAAEYNSVFQEILDFSLSLNISNVVIGGDMNTDFSRPNSLHTRALVDILNDSSYTSWLSFENNHIDYS